MTTRASDNSYLNFQYFYLFQIYLMSSLRFGFETPASASRRQFFWNPDLSNCSYHCFFQFAATLFERPEYNARSHKFGKTPFPDKYTTSLFFTH